jgi:hypothetical protein
MATSSERDPRVVQARVDAKRLELQQATEAGLTAIMPAMQRSLARVEAHLNRLTS